MAKRQRPKSGARRAARIASRINAMNASGTNPRKNARIAERQASRTGQVTGGTAAGSYPVVATPGYPVPLGQSEQPPPLPGTTGTTTPPMMAGGSDYSWSPAGAMHATTTNQEPADSWPPVDLPAPQTVGFMGTEGPVNDQASPETIYGQSADVETSPYYDWNEEPY